MWIDELLARPPLERAGNNLIYSAKSSAEWQRRQDGSVERYENESYNKDPRPAQMFGNFIATGLSDRNGVVLDIGCGLTEKLPHYTAQLGLSRYMGLEPLTVRVERSYPCLVGAIAEDMPLKDRSVDAVLFATSFDHIADAQGAMEETKRVLKSGASMFMWQGIADPDVFATSSTLYRLNRGPMAIPLVAAQAAVTSYRIRRRRNQLARGERLDEVHERWFTRKALIKAIKDWGFSVTRTLEPLGMASMFIEARMLHSSR